MSTDKTQLKQLLSEAAGMGPDNLMTDVELSVLTTIARGMHWEKQMHDSAVAFALHIELSMDTFKEKALNELPDGSEPEYFKYRDKYIVPGLFGYRVKEQLTDAAALHPGAFHTIQNAQAFIDGGDTCEVAKHGLP